eukprot:CAMPEP_0195103036 /NCGR_PEP_ID=MMETSP0448-20130528/70647_1 /TAXON_ID=66468 /ORGANISM="Heterocapsa triquestra, Strain CCMP 448" /LENGTH=35 /DNA_ID= /DNA_START= /DNA_END= /DNA_ORIENTATION=
MTRPPIRRRGVGKPAARCAAASVCVAFCLSQPPSS